jgi:hypothetical protein
MDKENEEKKGYELIEKSYNDFIGLIKEDKSFIKYIIGLSTGAIVFIFSFYDKSGTSNKLLIGSLLFLFFTILVGVIGIRYTDFHIKTLVLDKFHALSKPYVPFERKDKKFLSTKYDNIAVSLYYATLTLFVVGIIWLVRAII